jgi:hypothetical protein
MMFFALNGYQSIREAITGLFANPHKLGHLGLDYVVRHSTFLMLINVAQVKYLARYTWMSIKSMPMNLKYPIMQMQGYYNFPMIKIRNYCIQPDV